VDNCVSESVLNGAAVFINDYVLNIKYRVAVVCIPFIYLFAINEKYFYSVHMVAVFSSHLIAID
jgi:hypothetical protein